MSVPYGDPRGGCVLCREPAVEDVDAQNVDGDLIHDECLATEDDQDQMYLLPSPSVLFVMAARGLRSPWED